MADLLKLNWHRSLNFGDALNPYLSYKMWGLPCKKIKEGSDEYHVMMIGSILNEANSNTIVAGAGFIKEESSLKKFPKILSVRGRKTLNKLQSLGFDVSNIETGDPSILIPDYFQPSVEVKKYKIGIVPHIVDTENVNSIFGNIEGVKVIDLRLKSLDSPEEIEKIIEEIYSCERIISSSLHGLIIAHAYGIPGAWCEFSDGVIGNGFKFKDYYSSYGIEENIGPIDLRDIENPNTLSRIMEESIFLLPNTDLERIKMRDIIKNLYNYIYENKKMYFHI